VRRIGVVLLGQGLMGRVHSTALRVLPTLPGATLPELVGICGRDPAGLDDAQRRYGWARATRDWRELLELPGAELLVIATPDDLHAEPAVAALARGMHVLCEKPLAPTAVEAERMLRAAREHGRVHACGFNLRFVPALRIAREMIGTGAIGDVRAFRSRFLMRSGGTPWRRAAPGGVLLDLAVHHLDLARALAGEPAAVCAIARERDAVALLARFEGGATGALEAARAAGGHLLHSSVEVDGTLGTLAFDLGRLNELRWSEGATTRTLAVGDDSWWPPGHPVGWFESFVHQFGHVLAAVAEERDAGPQAATFDDGYRCALACDAALRSLRSGAFEPVGTHAPVAADS
jgi:predicted dehydrogenase